MPPAPGETVYFEIRIVGAFAKATAIDAATGIEVSIAGPANLPAEGLKSAALRKLRRALDTRAGT